jgi:hypothetical protein
VISRLQFKNRHRRIGAEEIAVTALSKPDRLGYFATRRECFKCLRYVPRYVGAANLIQRSN